jgi:hypothetical protein
VSDSTCVAADCNRASPDAFLCRGCTAKLTEILADFPAQLRELEITLSQQSNAARGGGKPTKASEQPLPFDMRAARLVYEIRNEAAGWIRHLCESRKVAVPQIGDTKAMIGWLYANVKTIRQDEAADALLAWAKALRADLASIVDSHEKRYRGPCIATVQPVEIGIIETAGGYSIEIGQTVGEARACGTDIYSRPGKDKFTCRKCGASYTAAERMMWTLASGRELMFTAAFIAAALTDSGKLVKVDRLYRWAKRGKLFAWQQDDLGRDLYRIGDVLDLLDEHENRKTERMSA